MKLNINLNDYCTLSVLTNADYILKNDQIQSENATTLADGSCQLHGKAVDSFHFVDHPRVTLSKDGDSILDFRCDCPQYRTARSFCPHCAALVLKTIAQTAITGSAAEAVEPPAESVNNADILDFSYAFSNSSRDLYPGVYRPEIPLKRFIQVFGDNLRAKALYRAYKPWGGSCFGMTISTTMFYVSGSGIDLTDFRDNARYPSQLELSDRSSSMEMTLHEFIEAGLILQSSNAIAYKRSVQMRRKSCLEDLCKAVEQFRQTGKDPVCLAVWDAGFQGGHSVFPYRLDRTDSAEDVLHIYDPNCPMQVRYAYLEKDDQGRYINWRFPMYNDYPYTNKTGGYISFDRYEHYMKAWERRGSPDVHVFMTTEPDTSVLDDDGNVLATITGSGIQCHTEEIFPHLPTGVGKNRSHSLFAPVAPYVLRNDDEDKDELTVHVAHTQQAISVQTESRTAQILVDDEAQLQYAAIPHPNTPYSITLTASLEGSWAEVKLEGITGSEGIRLAQHKGTLYCSPISEETPVSLSVNGEPENISILHTNIDEIFRVPEEDLVTNTDQTSDEANA
jgi:hypothetical protein